jgi:hypothetical protein
LEDEEEGSEGGKEKNERKEIEIQGNKDGNMALIWR